MCKQAPQGKSKESKGGFEGGPGELCVCEWNEEEEEEAQNTSKGAEMILDGEMWS
jgi:hypothetical protein